jgi:hypothetical protein
VVVFGRIDPVKVLSITAKTPQVKPGDYFVVDQLVEWRRYDCTDAMIAADFVDSLKYHHNTAVINAGVPHYGQDHVIREWQVPFTIPWGPTTYKSSVTFQCFPFYFAWPITIDIPDVQFAVVPPDESVSPAVPPVKKPP